MAKQTPTDELQEFFDALDGFRKHLRSKKLYQYLASTSFYVGRGTWNIAVNGILSANRAKRLERVAQNYFGASHEVVGTYWVYWTVRIYWKGNRPQRRTVVA